MSVSEGVIGTYLFGLVIAGPSGILYFLGSRAGVPRFLKPHISSTWVLHTVKL